MRCRAVREPLKRETMTLNSTFPRRYSLSPVILLQMLSNVTLSRKAVSQFRRPFLTSCTSHVPGRSKQPTTCTACSIIFPTLRHDVRIRHSVEPCWHDASRKRFLLCSCDVQLMVWDQFDNRWTPLDRLSGPQGTRWKIIRHKRHKPVVILWLVMIIFLWLFYISL